MRRTLLAALLCALGVPGLAQEAERGAAAAPSRDLLSLSAGLVRPTSRVGGVGGGRATNGDTSVLLGAQWLRELSGPLSAGLELDYMDRVGTVSPRLFPAAVSRVKGDSWLLLGVARASLPRLGRARPFLLAGAGGAYNTLSVDVRASNWADTNTQETRRLVDDAKWVPAACARAGVELEAPGTDGRAVVVLEGGWTGLGGARYAATPQGEALGWRDVTAPLHVIAFSARFGWRL